MGGVDGNSSEDSSSSEEEEGEGGSSNGKKRRSALKDTDREELERIGEDEDGIAMSGKVHPHAFGCGVHRFAKLFLLCCTLMCSLGPRRPTVLSDIGKLQRMYTSRRAALEGEPRRDWNQLRYFCLQDELNPR